MTSVHLKFCLGNVFATPGVLETIPHDEVIRALARHQSGDWGDLDAEDIQENEYWLGRRVVMPYRWIYCLLIPFGALAKVNLVWAWGDLMNALQIFPNLIGVLALSGIAAKVSHDRLRS